MVAEEHANHAGSLDSDLHLISRTFEQITVESGLCPVTGRLAFALYKGKMPIVPATIFLRHLGENDGLAPNTILAYAYALRVFFLYLQHNSLSFWGLKPATVKQFKKSQLQRTDAKGDFIFRRKTVQQYLNMVKGLIHYWRGLRDDDLLFSDSNAEMDGARTRIGMHGRLLHATWYARIPDTLWRVRIPISERQDKRNYKGLTSDASRRVMEVLNRVQHHICTFTFRSFKRY